jgi:hypothetical protein
LTLAWCNLLLLAGQVGSVGHWSMTKGKRQSKWYNWASSKKKKNTKKVINSLLSCVVVCLALSRRGSVEDATVDAYASKQERGSTYLGRC